jgi:hypothetical protein
VECGGLGHYICSQGCVGEECHVRAIMEATYMRHTRMLLC